VKTRQIEVRQRNKKNVKQRPLWHKPCFPQGVKLAPMTLALFGLWLSAAAAGGWWLHKYEIAQGMVMPTPERWPSMTRIKASRHSDTLVMFAHPRCPCTRASIEELNQLLARCQGKLETRVMFFQPSNYPPEWSHGSLWKSVAAIPGVIAQSDPDGLEARRFGAETSGFVVLYRASGELLFRGGITGSRGHAGDNAGVEAIVSIVNGETAASRQTPVFGCSLLDQCTVSGE
jgi:hypothetical protein